MVALMFWVLRRNIFQAGRLREAKIRIWTTHDVAAYITIACFFAPDQSCKPRIRRGFSKLTFFSHPGEKN
jgi:hypothetical protein